MKYLKDHGKEVVYDAEHFFDGYHANSAFALRTLEAAQKAGADVLVLCDTNGGTLTGRLTEIVADVRKRFDGVLGIHTHNDSDVAVANALAAVEQGCTHVQGCMNGYGERCGNANLCSIIANLELKLGHTTIGPEKLTGLSTVARFIAELANLPLRGDQPFVGHSAFAHKGGVHVSAVLKDSATYEHVTPEAVGNRQRVLVSDLSGRGNVLYKLKQHGLADRLERRRAARTAGAHQGDGVSGLRARGRRGNFRAAGARGAASGPALLRRGRLRGHDEIYRRGGLAIHGDGESAGAGRRAFGHRQRAGSGTRARSVPAQVPVLALSAYFRRPADGLQGARARAAGRGRRRECGCWWNGRTIARAGRRWGFPTT